MTYEEYRDKVIAAQEQWNQERSGIYLVQHAAQLSSIFAEQFQPTHLTGTDDGYDHMSLAQMQAAVSAMKPGAVQSASDVWSAISTDVSTSLQTFTTAFEATTNADSGWVGAAASAAVTAVNNYAAQSSTLPAAALAISLKLDEMRTGIEQTQALMPGVTNRPTLTGKTLPVDGEMKLDQYTEDEAEEEGRRILRTIYGQVAVQSDTGVPFMPTAPKIVDSGGGDTATPGGGSPGVPGGGSTGDRATTQQPTAETPQTEDPQATEPQNPAAPQEEGDTSEDSPASSDDDTSAASTTSPAATTPGATQPGSTTPTTPSPSSAPVGSAPGGSGVGVGAGGGSRGGSPGSTLSPGRAVAGMPGTGQPVAAATNTAAGGAAGRTGMGGMGAGAPGARGGGQNDEERRGVAEYLITQDNGEILTGISDIRTVPPVIGGDFDSAQQ
ncbi:hypothetical protein [Nocardia sp. MW-W600-9]